MLRPHILLAALLLMTMGAVPATAQTRFAPAPAAKVTAKPKGKIGRLTPRQWAGQAASRARLLVTRATTLPAHFWPMNRIAKVLAHGEPFTGITPRSAVKMALRNAQERKVGTVIGRLAPSLRDKWSIKGAEKSYMQLIGQLGAEKAKNRKLDVSIAFDPSYFGFEMIGVPEAERRQIAKTTIMRIARAAKEKGVPIELDSTTSDTNPFTFEVAKQVAKELRTPVRIAVAARYASSEGVIREWAALAKQTGVKLGVRLVKGSFVESEAPDAINRRAALMNQYKKIITLALEHSSDIDVAVATQNEDMFNHAQSESQRLGADYSVHVIRGVNPGLQQKMRAANRISKEYVSYGVDAPGFGISELYGNWRQRKAISKQKKIPRAELD